MDPQGTPSDPHENIGISDATTHTVNVRARHAALKGWPPLERGAAERLVVVMAESFGETPSAQFETEQGRGFYAALAEDDELLTAFVLLAQARAAARSLTVPEPPADFLARVLAPHPGSISREASTPTRIGLGLQRLRLAGGDLAERLAAAVERVAPLWQPLFSSLAPLPFRSGASLNLTLAGSPADAAATDALTGGERQIGDVDLSNGWHLHASADPTDAAAPDGPWTVEVGLTDSARGDLPVVGVEVLLGLAGEPTPRTATTDADGVAEFSEIPSSAVPDVEWYIPAAT